MVVEELTRPSRPGSGRATQPTNTAAEDQKVGAALSKLNPDDRRLVEAQEFCPILAQNRLGSMGKPFKVLIDEKPMFLCCEGCKEEALAHPIETLAKVEQLKREARKTVQGK